MSVQQYDPSFAAHVVQDGTAYCGVWPYRAVEPPPVATVSLSLTRGERWKATRALSSAPAKREGMTRADRVVRSLKDGAKTRGQLARNLHMSNGDLRIAVDELVAAGRVKQEVLPPSLVSHGQVTNLYSLKVPR